MNVQNSAYAAPNIPAVTPIGNANNVDGIKDTINIGSGSPLEVTPEIPPSQLVGVADGLLDKIKEQGGLSKIK